MALTVAGLQPGYLPWLGCFDQMRRVDLFLFADQLPFSRSGWVHRNRVLGPNGAFWLRLPYVLGHRGEAIDQVLLGRSPWRRGLERSLRQAYAPSPHAADEIDRLLAALPEAPERVAEVSIASIVHLAERLGITTPTVRSSALDLEGRYRGIATDQASPSHQILGYLQELGADRLLEGASGRSFLDVDLLRSHGIEVEFHDYVHPVYPQLHPGFTSHLSALDLLLTHGPSQAQAIMVAS